MPLDNYNQLWLEQNYYNLSDEQFGAFQKKVEQTLDKAHQDGVDLHPNEVRRWVVKEFV